MTDERKVELTALINETVGSIKNAKTVDELGLALEKMNDSRRAGEDEKDAEWLLKLFGRKIGELQESKESMSRFWVYTMIESSLVANLLMDHIDALGNMLNDPFDEFSA